MDIDDIRDEESLEAWLKTRPREDAVAIAHRAALRVFPLFGRGMREEWARERDLTTLPVLRAVLISGVARKYPTPEINEAAAAASAYAAASASAASAASADASAAASASAASAASADASAYAAAAAVIWAAIRADAVVIMGGSNVLQSPLWPDTPPDWFTRADRETRAIWAENPAHWEFWTRWWDAAIAGTPLDWDLQRDIALQIPDDLWRKGPGPVAEVIREIEARHAKPAESEVQQELRKLPPAPPERIAVVQKAMEANRETLPPTFDAIEGLISLEIERLLMRNYVDELDKLESQRQIGVFLALHEAVCGLRQALPETGPITEQDAAKSEKLMRVYAKKFTELPRAKADEVVEGVWDSAKGATKLGLILGTMKLGMSYGVDPLYGLAAGAYVFARPKAADIINLAKEAFNSAKGG